MKTMKIANSKITALYERLSRDDDLAGDTRTLYDKDGTPHVCVDTHMKRCLKIRLIRAVMRA